MLHKALLIAIVALVTNATAFAPTKMKRTHVLATSLQVYVPDGLTAEQYWKIRNEDKKRLGKDLGRLGPKGFKSRSMQAWQEAYEKGETGHAFAPFGYREQLKQGKIKLQDVPYMVRGGHWDNSDVFGALRLKWSKTDKEYAKGGYKKEQSVSVLGSGPGINWTGERREEDRNSKRIMPGFS
ncbi:hypothetical protein ACA910_013658 [Epithemia clementina (nom. ined.)]